jgi:hypothetical protein
MRERVQSCTCTAKNLCMTSRTLSRNDIILATVPFFLHGSILFTWFHSSTMVPSHSWLIDIKYSKAKHKEQSLCLSSRKTLPIVFAKKKPEMDTIGRILGRYRNKSLKSLPPCYSQAHSHLV